MIELGNDQENPHLAHVKIPAVAVRRLLRGNHVRPVKKCSSIVNLTLNLKVNNLTMVMNYLYFASWTVNSLFSLSKDVCALSARNRIVYH